jgi:hypothetical protein
MYVMLKKGLSFEEAYTFVKSSRPCINPNDGFVDQLKLYGGIGCKYEGSKYEGKLGL